MKRTEIAMIILIASLSVMISYFGGQALIGDVRNTSVNVKTADSITSNIATPDPAVFNSKAVNPTVEVIIGSDGQSLPKL